LDYQKDFASKNNKSLLYIHQMQHHYLFRTQLRLQQLMHRYSNKIRCLRKKLNRFRRRQEAVVVVEEGVEEEEEEEEEGLLLGKIVSIDQLLLHKY
jgi:isochorismate hydrolase